MIKARFYENEADLPYTLYLKEDDLLETTPHFHSAVEFILLKKGIVRAHIGDKTEILTEGDISFVDAYETHFYETLSDKVSAIVIVAASELSKSIREIYPNNTISTFLLNKEINKEFIEFANDWLLNTHKTPLFNLGQITILVSKIIEKYPLIETNNKVETDLIKKMLIYIHEHYLEEISLNKIANEFGFSVEHCSKTLKKVTKCNFRQYLNLLRLRKAKSLLDDRTINMTTSEILYSCGFSSVATYYRVKKQLGM